MKKPLILLTVIAMMGILSALDIDYSGEFRTRSAALYDDVSENLDNYIDTRMRVNLDGTIVENLGFKAGLQVGDFTWGDPWSTPLHVTANEAFIDYRSDALNANMIVGKQYWSDHRGLVFDDFFTGAMVKFDDLAGMKTDLIFMKHPIGVNNSTWYIANLGSETMLPVPFGITGMIGYVDDIKTENVTVLPYATFSMGPLTLDVNPFLDYQYRREEFGFGAALKADANLEKLSLTGDVLFASENGLTTLSPWYINGLYLYGIGEHHDGINAYWNSPYQYNADPFLSLVGKAKYELSEKFRVFAAGGLLTDIGIEGNAGFEYQVIPEAMSFNGFAALGINDNDTTDMALGASVEVKY